MPQKLSSRPIWSGSISFGLVTIPVQLFLAVREKTLHFRSLHDQDQVPLKMKLVCPAHDNREVHREHIVKGYEVEKDQYVVVHEEELEAVAPKATRSIDIQDFVDLESIDPVYFDRPYYIVPKPEGAKAYKLLVEAMSRKKKVGIARVVLHNKEHLAALRPLDDTLVMETMHFNDEVVNVQHIAAAHVKAKLDEREVKVAEQLIESLTADFQPEKYHDEYREQVLELVHKKARGEEVVRRAPTEPAPPKAGDLIAALEASLAKSRGQPPHSSRSRPGTSTAVATRRRKSA